MLLQMKSARHVLFILIGLITGVAAHAQVINLDAIIGPAGTNATTTGNVGFAVNLTGVALDVGVTTLTASGSTGSSSFDFTTRSIGSLASAGDVFADRKHDNGVSGLFILDTNNDGSFLDETQSNLSGFGLHGDTFITFDLAVIRANASLAPGTPFTLTGSAGQANWNPYGQTSAAIILDSTQLALFDWTESGPVNQFSTYTLSVAGSARYLTFIGLSGLDGSNYGAHVGFANVQLTAVPEPSTVLLLGAGLASLLPATLRRRRQP